MWLDGGRVRRTMEIENERLNLKFNFELCFILNSNKVNL